MDDHPDAMPSTSKVSIAFCIWRMTQPSSILNWHACFAPLQLHPYSSTLTAPPLLSTAPNATLTAPNATLTAPNATLTTTPNATLTQTSPLQQLQTPRNDMARQAFFQSRAGAGAGVVKHQRIQHAGGPHHPAGLSPKRPSVAASASPRRSSNASVGGAGSAAGAGDGGGVGGVGDANTGGSGGHTRRPSVNNQVGTPTPTPEPIPLNPKV